MSYILGNKVVKDTEEFNSYAYGITLPIKLGPTGYFEQSFNSFTQAESNLKNLLSTKQGERIMQPEFGTGLSRVLFEPMDDEFEEKVERAITNSVQYWLPYISINDIEIEMTDEMRDQNTAVLKVIFTVGNEIDLREITFTVQG